MNTSGWDVGPGDPRNSLMPVTMSTYWELAGCQDYFIQSILPFIKRVGFRVGGRKATRINYSDPDSLVDAWRSVEPQNLRISSRLQDPYGRPEFNLRWGVSVAVTPSDDGKPMWHWKMLRFLGSLEQGLLSTELRVLRLITCYCEDRDYSGRLWRPVVLGNGESAGSKVSRGGIEFWHRSICKLGW